MPNPQMPTTGNTKVKISSEDLCGNFRSGEREVTVVQNLIAGQYINIVEDGNTAEISADPSSGYYNKAEINEILGNLDTVQFRLVTALPAIGAANVIYLIKQEAPETGYLQYIWNIDDQAFHAIGDTDIDLADYYPKIQADDKFQEKITSGDAITTVTDSTELSQVNLTTKKVRQITASTVWDYIKTKLPITLVSSVSDETMMGSVDVNDAVSPVEAFSASTLWNYIKSKFTKDTLTTIDDNTKIGTVDTSKNNPVQEMTVKTLFDYMWKKIYPVGSIYTTITTDNPATLFGGTWVHLGENRVLWNVSEGSSAGSTLGAQLPNIKGTARTRVPTEYYNQTRWSGALGTFYSNAVNLDGEDGTRKDQTGEIYFNASKSNSIYTDNGTVRPPAYTVHFWRRTE